MALTDIVFRRLEVFINEFKDDTNKVTLTQSMRLGTPPIGFDQKFLENEFRLGLNGNSIGFGDLLTKPISKAEVSESTKISELVKSIVAKSSVGDRDLYEAKVSERVRLSLRKQIASLGGVQEKDILPTESVSEKLGDATVEHLLVALNDELKKYLIGGPIRKSDVKGTANAVKDDIVLRMLA